MIRMKGIRKEYHMGDNVLAALDGVDIHIKPHEFVSIIGPSGSGKSTLMNIIGCLDTPTSGEYILHGRTIRDLDEKQLAHIRSKEIGFIFQQFQLLPRLDALKNVELPLIYSGMSEKERKKRVREVLDRYARLDIAPYKGFVNPVYKPVFDKKGNIIDVKIDYTEGYIDQMLRYSKDYSPLTK